MPEPCRAPPARDADDTNQALTIAAASSSLQAAAPSLRSLFAAPRFLPVPVKLDDKEGKQRARRLDSSGVTNDDL